MHNGNTPSFRWQRYDNYLRFASFCGRIILFEHFALSRHHSRSTQLVAILMAYSNSLFEYGYSLGRACQRLAYAINITCTLPYLATGHPNDLLPSLLMEWKPAILRAVSPRLGRQRYELFVIWPWLLAKKGLSFWLDSPFLHRIGSQLSIIGIKSNKDFPSIPICVSKMFNMSVRMPNLKSLCPQLNFITIDENHFWSQLPFHLKYTLQKHSKWYNLA